MASISIVIPAYNEEKSIQETVESIERVFGETEHTVEIIVVDDCSTDATRSIALDTGATVISHPKNSGYGNSLLTGVRNAQHPWIGITDADDTYPVEELPSMVEEADERELDMLIGARQGKHYKGTWLKWWARLAFKWLTEFVVGQKVPDINSGLRVMRREMILRFAPVLSGGFSFTTTITIIAFLTNHFIEYRPVSYNLREGNSHVRYVRDTLRSAQIIVMTILFFNPIKLFILHFLGVLIVGLGAFVVALAFPSLSVPLAILSLFFLAANFLLAVGFLAEQQRINLSGIKIPKRGFIPRDRQKK